MSISTQQWSTTRIAWKGTWFGDTFSKIIGSRLLRTVSSQNLRRNQSNPQDTSLWSRLTDDILDSLFFKRINQNHHYILSRVVAHIHHVREFWLQWRATHQKPVHWLNAQVVLGVFTICTPAIDYSHLIRLLKVFSQPFSQPGEHLQCLFRARADSCSNSPHWLIGQDDIIRPDRGVSRVCSQDRC